MNNGNAEPGTQKNEESSSSKKSPGRSPSYPFVDLETAMEKAKKYYERERQNAAPKSIALGHWDYTPKSSGGLRMIAALKAYGLMSDTGGRVGLTQQALRLVVPGGRDRAQLLKEAALAPPEFKWLWEKYGSSLPSRQTLYHELLLERGYTESAAGDVIENYLKTIRYAELEQSDRMADIADEGGQQSPTGAKTAMQDHVIEAPAPQRSSLPPPMVVSEDLPPVTFPLPRGNMVEIRLKARVTAKEFQQLKQLLDLLGPSLIEGDEN